MLPKLNIVNVVATAELGEFIELEKLTTAEGFLYDRTIYHCAYLKDVNTQAKVLIFASGKMISVGTKSLKAAKHDLEYASKRLANLRLIKGRSVNAKLENIVATGNIGHTVDIERLSIKLPDVIYEPEQFPGAIYYAKELEGASILIFANGKVVFAGLKSLELLQTARQVLAELDKMLDLLHSLTQGVAR